MNGTPAIRLAVVDDHPIVVAGLQALLASQEGISLASTAASLQELNESWPAHYDVIFLDLNIPGESYKDSIMSIKAKYPKTHIIAYTSYNYPDLVRETLKLGCSGYLLKQISREEILKALMAVMAGVRYGGTEVTLARSERSRPKADSSELKDDFQ